MSHPSRSPGFLAKLLANLKVGGDRSPSKIDRTPNYTSNDTTTAPMHTGDAASDSPNERRNVNVPGRELPGTLEVTAPRYSKRPSGVLTLFICLNLLVYYRIYAEDGAIPSKVPVTLDNPFLGRIKARSVAPPHTAETVKRSIAKMEDIKDRTNASLFLTPYSQSPMGDADKVTILNSTGPGSTPQEPLALVAKMSDSERSVFESARRGGLASAQAGEIPYRMSINSLLLLFS